MNVLSIGTDRQLFITGSQTRERVFSYGALVSELHIIVLTVGTCFPRDHVGTVFLYPTNSWTRIGAFVSGFFLALRIIRDRGFRAIDSLITTQDPFEVGLLGYLVRAYSNLPLELQVHTTFFNTYFTSASLRARVQFFFARFLIPRVEHVRVVSRRIADYCVSVLGIANERITIVPIFTPTPTSVCGDAPDPKLPRTILMASRLVCEKRIDIAINAFAQLRETHPDVGLDIVGDGPLRADLEARVRCLDIASSVRFFPWTDNLVPFYQRASVFLLTSDYEGWGRTVVEAAYAGLPIVMTDVGLAGEVIRDGIEGLVAQPRDVPGIVRALSCIVDDGAFAKRLATAAQRAVAVLPDRAATLATYHTGWEVTLRGSWQGNPVMTIFRYLVSGGTAAAIGIVVFSLLMRSDIWYLTSSLLAFTAAFSVSFPLQKFWTFQDGTTHRMHLQISGYFLLTVVDMGVNAALMYGFVDGIGFYPLFAQLLTWGLIAFGNFIICRQWIFRS